MTTPGLDPDQTPSLPNRGNRSADRQDVVAMLKRDMSYQAVASAHLGEGSDSDFDLESPSNASGSSGGANSSHNGSHLDGSTTSRHSEKAGDQKDNNSNSEEEALEQDIDLRRKLIPLLLIVVTCLVVVAIAAISVGIRKEKEDEQMVIAESKESIATLTENNQKQQDNLQSSLLSFSHSLTASRRSHEAWPFLTSPTFEIQGQPLRAMFPGVQLLGFSPFVAPNQQLGWQYYSNATQTWIGDSWMYLLQTGNRDIDTVPMSVGPIAPMDTTADNGFDKLAPLWQTSPPPMTADTLNVDMLGVPEVAELYQQLQRDPSQYFGVVSPLLQNFPKLYGLEENENNTAPRSLLLLPVYDTLLMDEAEMVGFLQVVIDWEKLLLGLTTPAVELQKATLRNSCGDKPFHWTKEEENDNPANSSDSEAPIILEQVLGPNIGGCSYGVELQLKSSLDDENTHDIAGTLVAGLVPLAIALATLCLALLTLLQWIEMLDERHEKLVINNAKSSAIVASMFPSNIRERLYAEGDEALSKSKKDKRRNTSKTSQGVDETAKTRASDKTTKGVPEEDKNRECHPEGKPRITQSGSERLKNYLDTGGVGADKYSEPIADLFPNCTVLLADIAGFTAWSSVREPSQVFTLLETLYKNFDDIAKKRHVFKVETVGDCYVAVTGLPEPQEDHALIMVRFARDCMYKSYELTKKLEVTLGPDTAELSMRFGLHSGPVTAGVLRGDRARFQLFGDTVNTASRMESTGQKGRIQMSQETADILILSNKSHLVRQREDPVTAKGKGELTTFWLALGADPDDVVEDLTPKPPALARNTSGVDSIMEVKNEDDSDDDDDLLGDSFSTRDSKTVGSNASTMLSVRTAPSRRRPPAVSMSGLHGFKALREKEQNKESRLVDWNVEILGKLLKHVIARRNALGRGPFAEEVKLDLPEGRTVLEEVREIITLPKFDASAAKKQEDPDKMELHPAVKEQLHDYVSTLASMYRENPFHNYEHASHVTMSVVKLLSRIVAPKISEKMSSEEKLASKLHDHTYGITSDPLTQFAVVMSALIHDVDHTGVPNSQLVKENARVAAYYKNKSVAEQNSVDMSWSLLMEPQFRSLRQTIYCDEAELTRFRSLLVNAVMATDIVDKELKQLRNNRWDKAFSGEVPVTEEEVDAAVNRKATIVLEHLIQASDVSHTMQHWHVYRKWNERLFHEMYNAYRSGRAEKDPAEFWYKGEIGFFDFYIIPLAKKLKDCGVFGVSSDEYLNYAMKNREEWARKGESVTAEMVAKARDKDLARMERQASLRGPVIAEMKAAVLSMRSPQKQNDMFRQPSFRHLRTEPKTTESIAMPHHGFRRQPPNSRAPPRNVNQAVSIGTAERNALRQYRQTLPNRAENNLRSSGNDGTGANVPASLLSLPGRPDLGARGSSVDDDVLPAPSLLSLPGKPEFNPRSSEVDEAPAPAPGLSRSRPSTGMRKPERRCSNRFIE